MFTTDRDLLSLEPNLFRDVGWVGQRLVKASGTIAGNTLTISGQDVAFDAAAVSAGHVALVNGVGYEVASRTSATQVVLSRLRVSDADPILPPSPVTGADVQVTTFAPQRAIVHAQLLRMVGIEPQDAGAIVKESDIVNAASLSRIESLGALHLIFAAASSAGGPATAVAARAEFYRQRFAEERERGCVRLDLDADGIADATRRFNVVQFIRA